MKKSQAPSAVDRRRGAQHPAWLRDWLKMRGLSPSLPYCVMDSRGKWILGNARMAELLGFRRLPEFPVDAETFEKRWPFFNWEKSTVALLRHILRGHSESEKASLVILAEFGLKTFRLHIGEAQRKDQRLVVAELVRKGDLLGDTPSKETLFLSLSHEIRTAMSALKGTVQMLLEEGQFDSNDLRKNAEERVQRALERLNHVTHRLEEFKDDLMKDAKGKTP